MIAYFDSSAFVKLILDEPGSADARDLFKAAAVIQSSWLLVPESQAALARATRNSRLTPAGARRAVEVLRHVLPQVEALDLDGALAERAGDLTTAFPLRGSDAVHLASYERMSGDETVLVAADGELSRAAEALGYAIAVPGGR